MPLSRSRYRKTGRALLVVRAKSVFIGSRRAAPPRNIVPHSFPSVRRIRGGRREKIQKKRNTRPIRRRTTEAQISRSPSCTAPVRWTQPGRVINCFKDNEQERFCATGNHICWRAARRKHDISSGLFNVSVVGRNLAASEGGGSVSSPFK